jgi:hypothetical protein
LERGVGLDRCRHDPRRAIRDVRERGACLSCAASRRRGRSRSTKHSHAFFDPRTTCVAAVAPERTTAYHATGSYECTAAHDNAGSCELTTAYQSTTTLEVAKR